MSTEAFQAGVAALKSGNKALAREHLMKVVEHDETNEQAWLYLAGALEDPAEMRISLENVLHINPQNARAKQGLEWLRKQHPALFAEPTPALPGNEPVSYTGATVALADASAYTGATVALANQPVAQTPIATPALGQPLPAMQPPAPAKPMPTQIAPPALGDVPDVLPCPRCGAPTRYVDQRCRKCGMSLTIKTDRQGQSKAPAVVAGIMTLVPAILWTLLAIGLFILAGSLKTEFQKNALEGIAAKDQAAYLETIQPVLDRQFEMIGTPLLNLGAFCLLIGFLGIVVAIGLLKISKFGYFGSLIYNLFFLVVWGYLALGIAKNSDFIAAMLTNYAEQTMRNDPQPIVDPYSIVNVFEVVIKSIYFIAGYYLIVVVLLIIAWRTVSQKAVRFVPQMEELAEADGHFNRGVVYQKRGMWYLSMLEWERAVKLNPRDSTYRHALGLIYEQMKRPADALQQFEQALTDDPSNLRINQDRDRLVQTLRA